MSITVSVIGYGYVGRELARQIQECGWTVKNVVRKDGIYDIDDKGNATLREKWIESNPFKTGNEFAKQEQFAKLAAVTIGFIATPPSLEGHIGGKYASIFYRRGTRLTVTCDKSLVAWHPNATSSYGYNACVGGGTQLLPFIREQVRGKKDAVVDVILNATLNYIMSEFASIAEATQEAIQKRMVEPGSGNDLAIINREIDDTVFKTCIIFNDCFLSRPRRVDDVTKGADFLTPKKIKTIYVTETDVSRLTAERKTFRYIVSFNRLPYDRYRSDDEEIIGGFRCETSNGWHISAGFKRVKDAGYYSCGAYGGAINSAVIHDSDHNGLADLCPRIILGPGAFPYYTARTMIQDARRLLGIS